MTQTYPRQAQSPAPGLNTPGVRYRPALPVEETAVMALRRCCGWTSEGVPQQFRAMRDGRRQIWIAECEGYLVATITVEWHTEDSQLADGSTAAHISNLVVHPTYRHRGIARGLIDTVEHAATRRGCRLMTIGVDRGNAYARRIYEQLGYIYFKDYHAPWGLVHILTRRLFSARPSATLGQGLTV